MESDFVLQPRFSFDSPYLADYFGIWSCYEPVFRAIAERSNGVNLHAHVQSADVRQSVADRDSRMYGVSKDGIAQFSVQGVMMKSVPSMGDGTSTVRLRQQIRSAKRDPEVLGGILIMDTPGGTVKGNADLAAEVAAFAAAKPLYAYVEDMTASAGVSVASQATKRYANNASALYGAMGTYSVVSDMSGMAEKLGVKVHVIKAGEFKGLGEPGTPVTEEQLAELQRIVNSLNDGYLQLIASGLGKPVEQIKAMADGRVHPAGDAIRMGLIDGIQTYEQTYQQLVAAVSSSKSVSKPRSQIMATEKTPATLAELKATFPKSTAEWRETQLEAGASLSESAISYAKHVEAKAEEAAKAHAKALEDVKVKAGDDAKKATGSLGHKPIVQRGTANGAIEGDDYVETGDAIEDFNQAVAKVAGPHADLMRRQRAIRQVASSNPELYQAYLLATNPGKRQQRLINEKLEAIAK